MSLKMKMMEKLKDLREIPNKLIDNRPKILNIAHLPKDALNFFPKEPTITTEKPVIRDLVLERHKENIRKIMEVPDEPIDHMFKPVTFDERIYIPKPLTMPLTTTITTITNNGKIILTTTTTKISLNHLTSTTFTTSTTTIRTTITSGRKIFKEMEEESIDDIYDDLMSTFRDNQYRVANRRDSIGLKNVVKMQSRNEIWDYEMGLRNKSRQKIKTDAEKDPKIDETPLQNSPTVDNNSKLTEKLHDSIRMTLTTMSTTITITRTTLSTTSTKPKETQPIFPITSTVKITTTIMSTTSTTTLKSTTTKIMFSTRTTKTITSIRNYPATSLKNFSNSETDINSNSIIKTIPKTTTVTTTTTTTTTTKMASKNSTNSTDTINIRKVLEQNDTMNYSQLFSDGVQLKSTSTEKPSIVFDEPNKDSIDNSSISSHLGIVFHNETFKKEIRENKKQKRKINPKHWLQKRVQKAKKKFNQIFTKIFSPKHNQTVN
ncbi:hypothetical protein SNEBB_008134 [Seison nebaliae]|nr:hypothetical protein SNEBB_008134 [Seison nebaliae]